MFITFYLIPFATGEMAKEVGGHGGMDFIMDSRLVYCLQNGLPLDMDVYDLAEWCCLAELGELSIIRLRSHHIVLYFDHLSVFCADKCSSMVTITEVIAAGSCSLFYKCLTYYRLCVHSHQRLHTITTM